VSSRLQHFDQSITMAVFVRWPPRLMPRRGTAPGAPCSRQTVTASALASTLCGTTTATGRRPVALAAAMPAHLTRDH